MGTTHLLNSSDVYEFIVNASSRESDIARQLREETVETVEYSHMMTSPVQAQFIAFLVTLMQAKQIIEVGVFTGYATLAMAQVLPEDGRIIACDIGSDWPAIGQRYWQQAGVDHKIDLRIGRAAETLQAMLDQGVKEQFDCIFVDADKNNYDSYFDYAIQLLRPGGLAIFDNALRMHEAYVHQQSTPGARAVHDLCYRLKDDDRVDVSLVAVGEGMLLVRKR